MLCGRSESKNLCDWRALLLKLSALKTNELYGLATNTWAAKANMTTARKYLSVLYRQQ